MNSEDEPAGLSYFAFWIGSDPTGIPAASARAMARDDMEARREAERQEAERQDRREAECFIARQAGRQRIGLQGVFAAAERYAAAEDYRAERQAERDRYTDPGPAARSYLPGSEYEMERQLAQAQQSHRDLVAIQARRDPAGTEARARAKSERHHGGDLRRSDQYAPDPYRAQGHYDASTIVRNTDNAIVDVW